MILAYDKFSTIFVSMKEGHVIWDNPCKKILPNNPIKNSQNLSLIMAILLGINDTNLTDMQVL